MLDHEILRSTIAANICRLRRERGMSQQSVADAAGISRVTYNRIEKGHGIPGADVIFSLADVLGVPTDALRQVASPNTSFRTTA